MAPAYETILALVDVDEGLRSADPLEYELAWTFEDETLRVRFDDAPTIVGTERA